jgi:Arc/MetJ-type ribon-helix-helix transcriptional regulator
MQKMQILFPEPLLRKIRSFAEQEDRPMSEVIRRAVEKFLEMKSHQPRVERALPTFRGGQILVPAADLKANVYSDEPL